VSRTEELELQRKRAAKNQSLFRDVNERIEDLAARSSFSSFVCECMDETCVAEVTLTIAEYEYARSHANRFVVLPGHGVPEVEKVVEASERYVVVRKVGACEPVAESLDPRRRQSSTGDRADRHERAARTHDEAAERHEKSVAFWKAVGDEGRASLQRRRLENQREGAEIERDHAQLERDEGAAADD